MSNKGISVYAEALKRNEKEGYKALTQDSTRKVTPDITGSRKGSSEIPRDNPNDGSRDLARDISSGNLREKSRGFPTRDEIQEFTFRLRDELNVKVQAEVPHPWQDELDEIARKLDVKKLELYRFIIGEFLGKVKRKNSG